jgi:hypothetical protein
MPLSKTSALELVCYMKTAFIMFEVGGYQWTRYYPHGLPANQRMGKMVEDRAQNEELLCMWMRLLIASIMHRFFRLSSERNMDFMSWRLAS